MDNDAQTNDELEPEQTSALTTLANGAIYDRSAGRIVQGASLDHAQASAMARARWDKHKQALAEGAMDGTLANSPEAAVRVIMGVVSKRAADARDRDQLKAAELVLDKLAPDKGRDEDNPLGGLALGATKEGLDTLLAIIQEARALRDAGSR